MSTPSRSTLLTVCLAIGVLVHLVGLLSGCLGSSGSFTAMTAPDLLTGPIQLPMPMWFHLGNLALIVLSSTLSAILLVLTLGTLARQEWSREPMKLCLKVAIGWQAINYLGTVLLQGLTFNITIDNVAHQLAATPSVVPPDLLEMIATVSLIAGMALGLVFAALIAGLFVATLRGLEHEGTA